MHLTPLEAKIVVDHYKNAEGRVRYTEFCHFMENSKPWDLSEGGSKGTYYSHTHTPLTTLAAVPGFGGGGGQIELPLHVPTHSTIECYADFSMLQ